MGFCFFPYRLCVYFFVCLGATLGDAYGLLLNLHSESFLVMFQRPYPVPGIKHWWIMCSISVLPVTLSLWPLSGRFLKLGLVKEKQDTCFADLWGLVHLWNSFLEELMLFSISVNNLLCDSSYVPSMEATYCCSNESLPFKRQVFFLKIESPCHRNQPGRSCAEQSYSEGVCG